MKVCWFSAGVSSFIACYLAKDVDKIIYTHINDQHPDSIRFIHDCERVLNKEIIILQSQYFKCVSDVVRATGYFNVNYGAPCTNILKMKVRKQWEYENQGQHTYIWGFDVNEKIRAINLKEAMPKYNHEFPLINNKITKEMVHGICNSLGIKRPVMYDLGYHNNNCIGCVRGGKGYWNKIRNDFPDVFEARAKLEREVGHTCIKGVYLDELPLNAGRIEKEIMPECGIYCQLRGDY